jgi:hypothetical protein
MAASRERRTEQTHPKRIHDFKSQRRNLAAKITT